MTTGGAAEDGRTQSGTGAGPGGRTEGRSPSRPPNLLVIMSDEHGPMFSSPYGHPFVRTPHMAALAARGVTFDAAYCPSPLCVPSRAAFMTGKHLHRVGAYDNGAPFPSDAATWAHMLRAAGYEVVLDGKMHFIGPDSLHGFERQLARDQPGKIAGSEWLDPFPKGFRDGATTRRWIEEAGPGKRNNLIFDDEVEAAALGYLGAKGPAAPPWALCVSFLAPHFPLVVPEPYFSMYYPEHADLPAIPPGHLEGQHPAHERGRLAYDLYDYSEAQIRRCRAAYYGLVTHLDERIGRLLAALDAAALREDTVVVYTSDHGELLGEHGLWWKNDFYEQSARVPLIVSWPGPGPGARGARFGGAVSLLDLARTLVDLGGAPEPGDLDGHSLVPVLRDPEGAAWPDEAYCEYYGHSTNRAQRMLRTGRWKLNYYHGEPVELYDLLADPGEFENLAGREAYRPVEEALTRRVLSGWDPVAVEAAVRRSHRHRQIVGGRQFRVTSVGG